MPALASFQVTATGSLMQRLPEVADGARLVNSLARVMAFQNKLTVSHIQKEYMSFPKDQPPTMEGLRVQSNRLRNSLRDSKPEISGAKINSGIGSNVIYARIQEIGGQTKAHIIRAKNGKALAFNPGTGQFFTKMDFARELAGTRGKVRKAAAANFIDESGIIFLKVVHHPGSNMPARQYVQRGVEDRMGAYTAAFDQVIQAALAGGKS
jgi:phage gpG-like protein